MKYITLFELFLLNIFLGSITYLMFTFVLMIYFYEKQITILRKILYTFIQLIISILLSFIIWRFWFFNFDIMFGFILLPSLFAQVITFLSFIFFVRKYIR